MACTSTCSKDKQSVCEMENLSDDQVKAKIEEIRKMNPSNLMAKHFQIEWYKKLSPELKKRVLKVMKSGLENQTSKVGMYGMHPDDYLSAFKPYFDAVLGEYHKINGKIHHVSNWDISSVKDKLPPSGTLDLAQLGLGPTSMRVRVARNLAENPLPGAMSRKERVAIEEKVAKALTEGNPLGEGGSFHSLTPGSKYEISPKQYEQLVKDHVMFKDMASDPYLRSAGISADWPYGRGCFVSADKQTIVWVGEEDHLRIMCMKVGTLLTDVFFRLKEVCDLVEKKVGKFAISPDYGYITSCPTNIGTGMRASIHVKIPKLTKDGTATKAENICKGLALSVRGVGGEHTPIGSDGTVDISPSARLHVQEADIIIALYKGIEALLKEENKL